MSDIIKIKKTRDFTIICNEIYRNDNISARAKGLHTYLMTLPDGWQVNRLEVFTHFSEGRDAMNKAFKELQDAGYIVKKQQGRETGKFGAVEYHILESITADWKTVNGKPVTGKPLTENPQLLNTEEVSTEKKTPKAPRGVGENIAEIAERDAAFSAFYAAYPKKRGKPQAQKAFIKHYKNLPPAPELLHILDQLKKTEQWQKQNGQFIPYPASWLNAEGWNDDIPEPWVDPEKKAAAAAGATKDVFWHVCPDCGYLVKTIGLRDQCPVCGEYGTSFRQCRGKQYPEGVKQ